MNGLTARQPILDKNKKIIGYELLYRDEKNTIINEAFISDGNAATSYILLNVYFDFQLKEISEDKDVYINIPSIDILEKFIDFNANPKIVLEILETMDLNEKLISIIKKLHKYGHRIALDDYDFDPKWDPYLPYMNIIKVDINECKKQENIKNSFNSLKNKTSALLLAEKVETMEDYKMTKKCGFDLFQGYFFAKPKFIKFHKPPYKNKTIALFYMETNKDEMDFNKISEIIELDLSLSYRFIKYVNTISGLKNNEIRSIRSAVIFAGEKNLRHFVNLLVFNESFKNKPIALHQLATQRSKFCELISRYNHKLNIKPESAAMLGLFSCLDALLDQPMQDIVGDINIDNDIKNALLGKDNKYKILIDLYTFFEKSDFSKIEHIIEKYNLSAKELNHIYINSIKWSNHKNHY